MKDRLKALRKELGLTQAAFADRLNLGRGTLANYEVGRNVPLEPVITLICRTFGVNETWLRTGEGKMFEQPHNELEAMAKKYGLSPRETRAVKQFVQLSEPSRKVLLDYFVSLADAIREEENNIEQTIERQVDAYREKLYAEARSGRSRDRPMTDAELHAELQRQIDAEREATGESLAPGSGNSVADTA